MTISRATRAMVASGVILPDKGRRTTHEEDDVVLLSWSSIMPACWRRFAPVGLLLV
jgi:hypothetical protein